MVLTPNEIANKKFNKSMSGYRIDDVEDFLGNVSATVRQLTEEKQDLERKLEILADKLEEYRQDEDSLRTALLGAQKLGDGVIRESKTKAEIIMRDATIKADKLIAGAQQQIEMEQQNLVKLQREVANFKSRLTALYKQHLALISALPEVEEVLPAREAPAPVAEPEEDTYRPQAEEEFTVEAEVETTVPDREEEPQPRREVPDFGKFSFEEDAAEDVEEEEDDIIARRRPSHNTDPESRFGPLKFGEGFGLTHEDEQPKKKK